MVLLDLDEVTEVLKKNWLWSNSRWAVASFQRRDHLGDPRQPLIDCVRELVQQRGFPRPEGPVRLLTHLRYFGYLMNPVSFYYCYDSAERLQNIVAHVTNTPWGESHSYVLGSDDWQTCMLLRRGRIDLDQLMAKDFHVSPFLPMNMAYAWGIRRPGQRLQVHIENYSRNGSHCSHAPQTDVACGHEVEAQQASRHETAPPPEPAEPRVVQSTSHGTDRDHDRALLKKFDVTMSLNRSEITTGNLYRVLWRYPWMTAQVIGGIYWQALRLKLKKVPFFPHPRKADRQPQPAANTPTDADSLENSHDKLTRNNGCPNDATEQQSHRLEMPTRPVT